MRCKEIPTDRKSEPEIHVRKIMLLIIVYNDNVENRFWVNAEGHLRIFFLCSLHKLPKILERK